MFDHIALPSRRSKQIGKYAVFALLLVGLCACAAGSTDAQHSTQVGGLSTFVLGFWHGIIAPLTLLVEVINQFAATDLPWSPRMYQEGAGVVYDIGFFIGLVAGPSILWTGSLRRG